jgi:hypothetical protein
LVVEALGRSDVHWSVLLFAGVLKHYGYYAARPEWHADVKNIVGAALTILVIWVWAWKWRPLALVAIWWTFEELQVITCSILYMVEPWVVKEGEDQCSALIGFNLASIGLLMIGGILLWRLRTGE